jgi:hypothetical protein
MPIVFPAPSVEEPQEKGGSERRVSVRFPFTAAAEVYELRSKARMAGRCSDLSIGGCYIDTLSPFALGCAVRIRMEADHREFEADAVVAYAHPQMGMGLRFTGIKREHEEVLRLWIAELGGEQAAEPAVSPVEPEPEAGAIDAIENTRLVLNELITLLVRSKIITGNDGVRLLREMFR